MSPSRVVFSSQRQPLGRRRPNPAVEPLEGRRLLSAAAAAAVPWQHVAREAQVSSRDLSIGPGVPVATVSGAPTQTASLAGGSGLKIVLEEGPNLRANPTAAAAFRKGADFIQSLFADPITLVVDAEIAPLGPGVIGQTES